jgi:hypothetical protein
LTVSIIMECHFGLHLQSSEPIWQNPRPLLLQVQEGEVVGVGDLGVVVVATGVAVGVVGEASGAATVTVMEGVGVITNKWGHPAEMEAGDQCGTVPLSRPIPAVTAIEGVIFIHVGMTAAVRVAGLVTISTGMTAEVTVAGLVTIRPGMTAAVTVELVAISAGMTAVKVVAVTTNAKMIEAMEAAAVADTNLIRSVFIMRKFKLFLFHFHLVDCIHKCEINANLTLN